MEDVVIVAAARTAVGKFGGTLAKTPATELGAAVVTDLLKRARLSGEQISEVILGQVLQAGAGHGAGEGGRDDDEPGWRPAGVPGQDRERPRAGRALTARSRAPSRGTGGHKGR